MAIVASIILILRTIVCIDDFLWAIQSKEAGHAVDKAFEIIVHCQQLLFK